MTIKPKVFKWNGCWYCVGNHDGTNWMYVFSSWDLAIDTALAISKP